MKRSKMEWHNLLQFKKHFPRHVIVTQLSIRGRLMTGERLQRCGLINQDDYSLCNQGTKDFNHLFFFYNLSKEIKSNILLLCSGRQTFFPQNDYVMVCNRRWKDKTLKNLFSKLSISAYVYAIQRERNNVCFNRVELAKSQSLLILRNGTQKGSLFIITLKIQRKT